MKFNEQAAVANHLWTAPMYHYLAWCLLENVYGTTEWIENEEKNIIALKQVSGEMLDSKQKKIVENRARRLADEYEEHTVHVLEKMHWHEPYDDDHDYGEDGFIRPHVTYDQKIAETWKDAVRRRQTVKMTYDSATSGMSERLVDPYKTGSPYGEGYCHSRKEVRKFRFDRIIYIELTDKTFVKPKEW